MFTLNNVVKTIFNTNSWLGLLFLLLSNSQSVQAENYKSTASIAAMINQFSDYEMAKEQLCNDLLLYVEWIETAYRTSYDLTSIKIDLTVCDKMDLDKIRVLTHEVVCRPQKQLKPAVLFMNGENRLMVYEDKSGTMRRYERIGDPELDEYHFGRGWRVVDGVDLDNVLLAFIDPYSGLAPEKYEESKKYKSISKIKSQKILPADVIVETVVIEMPDEVRDLYENNEEEKYMFEHDLVSCRKQKSLQINVKDEAVLQELVKYFTPGQDKKTLESRIRDSLKGTWGQVPLALFLPEMPRSRLNTFKYRESSANPSEKIYPNCFNAAMNFFKGDTEDGSNASQSLEVFLSFNYCKVGNYNEKTVLAYGDVLYFSGVHAARFLFKDKEGRNWIFEKMAIEPATPWRVTTIESAYKNYMEFFRGDVVLEVYRRCDPE